MTTFSNHVRRFFASPAGGATILLLASVLGFAMANSPWKADYTVLITWPMKLSLLGNHGPCNSAEWVSDGLMTLFFVTVILEIKKEIISGHLSSPRQVALPLIGAVGGMMVPALTYLMVTHGHPDISGGWAIPVATDAAFTLPVIMALGQRVSTGARVWLMALAIFDDVLGIIVIALFYGTAPDLDALIAAFIIAAALVCMNRAGIGTVWPYAAGCAFLWITLLNSGLHPTLAGVMTGLGLPATSSGRDIRRSTPLDTTASILGPVVTWGILPLFGFMNAGISLAGMSTGMLLEPLPLGIMLGLLIGKPVGVFGTTMLAARLKIATLPSGTSIKTLFGLSLLCGIGFTISIFISGLAFSASNTVSLAKMGIFAGSAIAATIGWLWLRFLPMAGHSARPSAPYVP
ncbi:Na+/H+ antiporter NhaA [Komagataeibacter sp. FXV3]|uniref:Na+/H+ antiporter NhaA n=1 Tax=Komagataeibacter sp. FXV3 TaxID=2608998 RepID=UPI00187B6B5F|nr:Na+/H+ antiporter NhaA [Komagataeibacter sp. FXV3]MBE7728384.1 Na+/H+ antiporter NhaA [Komagataeibacter sp. FXV3]